jgi:hypothetical protein
MPTPPSRECRVRQPETDKLDTRPRDQRESPDVLIARWAAEEWGVLSLAELLACGLNRQAVSVRVRNGRLHPRHRGVYAVGHPNLPLPGQFLAAVKACGPTAALSNFSSAAHLGFVRWDGRHPEVTVVGTATRSHQGIRVHRTKFLDPRDVIRHQAFRRRAPRRRSSTWRRRFPTRHSAAPSARPRPSR